MGVVDGVVVDLEVTVHLVEVAEWAEAAEVLITLIWD